VGVPLPVKLRKLKDFCKEIQQNEERLTGKGFTHTHRQNIADFLEFFTSSNRRQKIDKRADFSKRVSLFLLGFLGEGNNESAKMYTKKTISPHFSDINTS
jgi:hypothetical protein